jgi:hypothetical protein
MNGGFRLTAVQPTSRNFSDRHKPVIEPARKAVGYRDAWWLKIGWIDRLEGAILGVLAEISQISDAPGL